MGLLTAIPRREDMATAPHAQLYMARAKATDPEIQGLLAGYEHRAFAREAVEDNPLMALSLLVATPAYQLAKMSGLTGSRSKPSMSQMGQGLLGIGEGLYNRFSK